MPQFAPDVDGIFVEIAPDGAGCILTLTQEGLPPGYKEASKAGWGKMFDALAAALR
jgi:hypothetical protein